MDAGETACTITVVGFPISFLLNGILGVLLWTQRKKGAPITTG